MYARPRIHRAESFLTSVHIFCLTDKGGRPQGVLLHTNKLTAKAKRLCWIKHKAFRKSFSELIHALENRVHFFKNPYLHKYSVI